MVRRLILDTGVLIAAERSELALASVLTEDDDVAVAPITVAELRTGIELADDRRRAARVDFVVALLAILPVEPYDALTAEAHGRLLAHVHRSGSMHGAHDLIVAATAAATGRTLVSTDRGARFGELPGVECVVVG